MKERRTEKTSANKMIFSSRPSKLQAKGCRIVLWLLLTKLLSIVLSAPLGSRHPLKSLTAVEATKYLRDFGYLSKLNPETSPIVTAEGFEEAVGDFQRFIGLNATGVLNTETKKLMLTPRCGVPDNIDSSIYAFSVNATGHSRRRAKRFVIQGSKWAGKTEPTYNISKYTNQLPKSDIDRIVNKAFGLWSRHAKIKFSKLQRGENRADIDIKFATYDHGSCESFDGLGPVLAHAAYPESSGYVHFDDSEEWTDGTVRGKNLYRTAVHEFGHSLGLKHSDEPKSVMAPIQAVYKEGDYQLEFDDIEAVQYLYGAPGRINSVEIDLVKQNSSFVPNARYELGRKWHEATTDFACAKDSQILVPKIDAITQLPNGTVFAFMGDEYFKLEDFGFEYGYPRKINRDWPGLPNNLDAAVTWPNGETFFFKDNEYWKFHDCLPVNDYPVLISVGFPGVPDNIDAAFVWPGNGKTYFIKDSQYWRYDSQSEPPVSTDYPKDLSFWKDLPYRIDAAMQWKNKTYFFANSTYYQFDTKTFSVDIGFPRSTTTWWFGCQWHSETLVAAPPKYGKARTALHFVSRGLDGIRNYGSNVKNAAKKIIKKIGSHISLLS